MPQVKYWMDHWDDGNNSNMWTINLTPVCFDDKIIHNGYHKSPDVSNLAVTYLASYITRIVHFVSQKKDTSLGFFPSYGVYKL